ncbi:metallo-beta-lactamase superfamily protein [Mycobacterium ulcerans str. Harvey]|uniref:Metallo-beta-lactamase superfamily protein n=1 Tax=Mycobacterium ulcerans str. Harvey TaxID=1299332 RepID=A0ABP3AIF8_MYCUL|nr:metallo-beta-lactamase superfamily protein [Mycobacterium ulcerans str. Harvey]
MTVVDDNYTGHVDPGTVARRTLPGATILKASVGPVDNNAYLVTCSATGQTLLIDAANDAEVLIDLIRRYAPKIALIVTSHQHFDHWQALQAVAEATGAPTAAHEIDAEPLPVKPDRLLANGDRVQIGELSFDVIHLRGHTPDPSRWPWTGLPRAESPNCSPVTVYSRAGSARPGSRVTSPS